MSVPGSKITPEEKRDSEVSKLPCIVGFGMDGVHIGIPEKNWEGDITTQLVVRDFAHDLGGWRVDVHPRMLADTTGDGHKDIVGFGAFGVWIARNTGNRTFERHALVLWNFCYSFGWRCDKHIRLLADLRGTGRTDIVGFGDAGVFVSLNEGGGKFGSVIKVMEAFGTKQEWELHKHPRFLADVTGDGLPDIVGFGSNRVHIARSRGDGTFSSPLAEPMLDDFSYEYGWRVDQHPRLVVDLTGDGRADIIGFKNDGAFVSLNDGQGNFGPMLLAVHAFGTCHGWHTDLHPRFVLPLTRKKTADIVGFGHSGVFVALGNGDGTFSRPKMVLDAFGVSQGWRVNKHPRFLVDLTGNGCPDIIGFGEDAIWISYSDGNGGFGPIQRKTRHFTAGQGWANDKTVRYVSTL